MGFLDRMKKTTPSSQATPAPAAATASAPKRGGIDLAKRAPGLIDLNKKAAISLEKHSLSGVSAAVYLVGDHSGSMRQHYSTGAVQQLAERVLAAAVEFDDDGSIPVILFDSIAHPAVEVSIDDYQGSIDRAKDAAGHWGTTDYAAAMRAVINHYKASGATAPAFVVFQTDGSPDNRRAAEKLLCEASTLPIFWQFIGFGNDSFEFLRKLDDLAVPAKRAVDNAGFFAAGSNPQAMSAEDLYDNLMNEFPSWLRAARQQGIVQG